MVYDVAVVGLSKHPVKSYDDVLRLVNQGTISRLAQQGTTGTTLQSSPSHAVIILTITQVKITILGYLIAHL